MNIKDIKLEHHQMFVRCDKETEYTDDNGNYYELWEDTPPSYI